MTANRANTTPLSPRSDVDLTAVTVVTINNTTRAGTAALQSGSVKRCCTRFWKRVIRGSRRRLFANRSYACETKVWPTNPAADDWNEIAVPAAATEAIPAAARENVPPAASAGAVIGAPNEY